MMEFLKKRRWYVAGGLAGLAILFIAFRGQPVVVPMTQPVQRDVLEYVAEEAKTRLADEYVVDMPVSGTLQRIQLEVGHFVEQGDLLVKVDPYELQHRVAELEARIRQAQANASGVDVNKPKSEDFESAQIRVKEMQDALEVAKKARKVAELNFEEALREYDRARGLLQAGAVSQSYVDVAETRYKSRAEDLKRLELEQEAAEKSLVQAQLAYTRLTGSIDDNEYIREAYLAEAAALAAQLAVLRNDLAKTEVRAPVSGPVLEKYVEDSRVLQAGTPLLRLGDMSTIEIESDILSEEVTAMSPGDPVHIMGKALGEETLMGEVTRIYPSGFKKISSLGIEQQRVKILVGFDNSEPKLRPGTTLDVRVVTNQASDVLAVPDRAVFRSGNEWFLYVVRGGRARQTPVDIGLRNEEWAELRDGVSASDTIVAELVNELSDGVRVSPLD